MNFFTRETNELSEEIQETEKVGMKYLEKQRESREKKDSLRKSQKERFFYFFPHYEYNQLKHVNSN